MFQNAVSNVARLYSKSRVNSDADWYYDKKLNLSEQGDDGANEEKKSATATEKSQTVEEK